MLELNMGTSIARAVNPSNTISDRTSRTWNDANHNFVPDCDFFNPSANGECGTTDNKLFGTSQITTRYSQDLTQGFGVRPYDWQTTAAVQQQVVPGTSVEVGYFRTSFGGQTATSNLAVTPANFDPYCITVPADSRLPGGGGNRLCGLYDINPAKLGQVNNLVDPVGKYGSQSEIYNGVDVSFRSRFGRSGLLQGGVSTGRLVTDNCYQNALPNVTAQGFVAGTPRTDDFCHITPPWSADTQFKLSAVYPLPFDVNVAATYQNLAGANITSTYVATNAQIAPSLGRNLAVGAGGTVTINLIAPQTQFDNRINQVDLRFSKAVKVGKARVQGMLDIYNVLNSDTILGVVARYGPAWLTPSSVMGARLFKLGAQLDF